MSQRLQREHLTMGENGIVIILCATPFRTQICQKSHTLNRISTNSFPARWRPPAEIRAELVRRGPHMSPHSHFTDEAEVESGK